MTFETENISFNFENYLWRYALKYSELNLVPSLKLSIEKLNYVDCTPIQVEAIPLIMQGKDLSGLAQTGTGKTAAFLIPLMQRILMAKENLPASEDLKQIPFEDWKPFHFILILVPTRELAEQVFENIEKFTELTGLRGTSIYGGTGYDKQKEAIRNGVEFVVATPGRLIDLYKEHVIDLKQVRAIVFDEADRMFDMGFKEDMKYILQRVPAQRQFLVFSATLNFDVLNTAYQFGAEPVEINISRDQAKAENVKDVIIHLGHDEKPMYLLSLLKKAQPQQAIIFTNFKNSVDKIAKFLTDNSFPAIGISSLISQTQRNKVLEQFKAQNHLNILVATDVAARGLDIKGVDLVINFELPSDSESYVHRIGRTGRAGTEGIAYSLVCDRDIDSLYRIEEYLKHKVEILFLEDQELIKDVKPMRHDNFQYEKPQKFNKKDSGEYKGPRSSHKKEFTKNKFEKNSDRKFNGKPELGSGTKTDKGPHPKFQSQRNHGVNSKSQNPQGKYSADNRKNLNQKHLPKDSNKAKTTTRVQHKKQESLGKKISNFFKNLFN